MVMLNNDLQPETPQTASIPINSNLTVHVGNNVRIDASGLKARLTGDLKVAQDKQASRMVKSIFLTAAYGRDPLVQL